VEEDSMSAVFVALMATGYLTFLAFAVVFD